MSRRSLTLLIASVGTAVAIAVRVLVPVPYVILGPGPTLNPLEAVGPETEICPAGQTQKQTQEQDTQQMTSSQQTATAAALTELDIPYSTQVVVAQAEKGFPAYGVLKPGDVITKVNGQPVTSQTSLTSLIRAHPAGSTLTVSITRNGQRQQVQVRTRASG